MKIITIGNGVIDYYSDMNKMFPGGSALNVAVFSKRFGVEKSSFIGIIGTDYEGMHIEEVLRRESVDTTRMRKVVGETSKVTIKLDEEKDRIIGTWDKGVQAFVSIQLNEDDYAFIQSHDVLHVGLNSFLDEELESLSQIIALSYDFSTRRDKEHLERICPYLTYAFFSGSDLSQEECKELMEYVHQLGTQYVLITRAEKGAILSDSKTIYEQTIQPTEVKDTLGAGDSFVAMTLATISGSTNLQDVLQQSTNAATQICCSLGAIGHSLTMNQT